MKAILLLLILVAFLGILLFPRTIPRLLKRAGRSARTAGRLGFELTTGEELEKSPLAHYEAKAGEIVALRLLSENALAQDRRLQQALSAIGARLTPQAQRRQINYRFEVLDAAEPNALAVPGGSIFVTKALIELCGEDSDALACVLAHELVHIDQRHAIKNLAASTAMKTGFRLFTLGRGALLGKLAGGMKDLIVQGYRQDQEIEADIFGVRLARLAGFDPRGMIRLLERLRELRPDGQGPLVELFQYFRSHPPIDQRLARLRLELG